MLLAGMAVLIFCTGCVTRYSPTQVKDLLSSAVEAAESHKSNGNEIEARQIVEAVLAIDSEDEVAQALSSSLEKTEYLYKHTMLGSNLSRRPAVLRTPGLKVLLYLPDRILDILDLVSFDVHLGPGLYANVHATRAVQVGAGGRAVGGIGWHDHRSLGFMGQGESGLTFFGAGAQVYSGALVGTSGVFAVNNTLLGWHRPSSMFYQRMRDYWAVGLSLSAILVGADVDFHPIEFADMILGFGTIDILRDDFANTRGLKLSRKDRNLLRKLHEARRSKETMQAYQESRKSLEPSPTPAD
jgi:hypothetical protein